MTELFIILNCFKETIIMDFKIIPQWHTTQKMSNCCNLKFLISFLFLRLALLMTRVCFRNTLVNIFYLHALEHIIGASYFSMHWQFEVDCWNTGKHTWIVCGVRLSQLVPLRATDTSEMSPVLTINDLIWSCRTRTNKTGQSFLLSGCQEIISYAVHTYR